MFYSVAPTYNNWIDFPDPDIYIKVPILKNRLCWIFLVKRPLTTILYSVKNACKYDRHTCK